MRAPRFALQIPIRYRPLGDAEWREGRTVNISRTGLLFQADRPLQIDTSVEMSFVLPFADLGPEVFCEGRVVRTVPPPRPDVPLELAATIADFRFVPGQNA